MMGQGSNPCMVLNSYHAGCQYDLVEDCGPPHNRQFVFKVVVLGVAYTGKGSSKKRAKQAAAASALRSIYNINLSLGMETPAPSFVPGGCMIAGSEPSRVAASGDAKDGGGKTNTEKGEFINSKRSD